MRNTIIKFMGVVGLLLATACAEQGDDGDVTRPDDGEITLDGCKVAGCNSELCIEATDEVYTTCEWREEYACYQAATCERQSSGVCNWTQTPQLLACLDEAQKQ
jgi:hypothetical protein